MSTWKEDGCTPIAAGLPAQLDIRCYRLHNHWAKYPDASLVVFERSVDSTDSRFTGLPINLIDHAVWSLAAQVGQLDRERHCRAGGGSDCRSFVHGCSSPTIILQGPSRKAASSANKSSIR